LVRSKIKENSGRRNQLIKEMINYNRSQQLKLVDLIC